MPKTTLTKLELRIMEAVWNHGACSVREIQEAFPARSRPAYTTVQTTVYRLEGKGALRCVKRISNANIFEAAITRDEVGSRMIDEILALFGGGTRPVMAHLIESGKLTLDDIKDAEEALKARRKKS
jgi:BlaI family transcriptional regulator, penicillinase repressor